MIGDEVTGETHKELYMAGLWKAFDGVQKFVILTTAPNASVADIHNRMPIVLPRGAVKSWVSDTDAALRLLGQVPPLLARESV